MNRKQMIAWLALEGVILNTAPIVGDPDGRHVWAARDGEDELQRYMDKPDRWDRYDNHPVSDDRIPVSMDDLTQKELKDLYLDVMKHREENTHD